jgi:parallel beta-helix repeat protein
MKQWLVFVTLVFQYSMNWAQVVYVNNAIQLEDALISAIPGQIITLADGIYTRNGGFYVPAGINGTKESPIKIMGSSKAVITSNNLTTGYGLGLRGNSYWILEGFTVYNSKKGIVLDNSHHNIINKININKIGEEGIHLRTYSSYNTVQNCTIDSLGLNTPCCGEGIYIGSAYNNWSTYTNGYPDTCNYNVIHANVFGDHIVSENIDIKEGTTGGVISNNILNGTGLNNMNGGDSWIDVKGNHYTIKGNCGHNSIADGIQTHIQVAGWGNYNIFTGNTLNVNGPGYGIKILTSNDVGSAYENKVCTNNSTTNSGSGLTNIATQTCE